MRVSVSPAFVLFWTALYFFDDGGVFRPLALSVAVHELCHLAAIRLTGGRASKLELRLNGLVIVTGVTSYVRELICALAGPAGSAALAIGAAKAGMYTLSGVSGALCVFNLLPVAPLDGGRALYCLTAWLWGVRAAEKSALIGAVTVICCAAVMWAVTGAWIFIYIAVISCCQIGGHGVKCRV